jgi:hypothetical protein
MSAWWSHQPLRREEGDCNFPPQRRISPSLHTYIPPPTLRAGFPGKGEVNASAISGTIGRIHRWTWHSGW